MNSRQRVLAALNHQQPDCVPLDLGASPGVSRDTSDGLTRFKQGWATGTRMAYFCGRIFDRDKYAWIVGAKSARDTDYFPAYRKGEFA